MRREIAYMLRLLLAALIEKPEEPTDEQRAWVGTAARRLLVFAWDQNPPHHWLINGALQAVCRTFESDPVASAELVRRILEPAHLQQFAVEEMPGLAREIKRLFTLDAALVEDVYCAAFGHTEVNKEETFFGGRIIGFRSNRRQDYGSALYQLGESYPEFLKQAPLHATRALIALLEEYVKQHQTTALKYSVEESFVFEDQQIHMQPDGSSIWDTTGDSHDDTIKMLNAWQGYFDQLASNPNNIDGLRQVLAILLTENRLAVLWRRLLMSAARAPGTLGREIKALAWSPPILTGYDTSVEAGNFIAALFGTLDVADRERVERTILTIPDTVANDRREAAEERRNDLLGCLPVEHLVTTDTRRLLDQLTHVGDVPPHSASSKHTRSAGRRYNEQPYLHEQGMPTETEANRRMGELTAPIKQWSSEHLNTVPITDDVHAILPALQALRNALLTAHQDGVYPAQRDTAWEHLVSACERIVRWEELDCAAAPGAFIRDILLEASRDVDPDPPTDNSTQFDEHLFWGPAPRIAAAIGLTYLAHQASCVDNKVLEAVERLAMDDVSEVRFQVARYLHALHDPAPDLMWRLLDHYNGKC